MRFSLQIPIILFTAAQRTRVCSPPFARMLVSVRAYGGEQSINQTKRISGFRTSALPMEGLERGRRVFPRGLAQGVDDERGYYDHDASDDKHSIPHGFTAHGNLSGRDETQYEGQQ